MIILKLADHSRVRLPIDINWIHRQYIRSSFPDSCFKVLPDGTRRMSCVSLCLHSLQSLSQDLLHDADQDLPRLIVPMFRLISSWILGELRKFEKKAPQTFQFHTTSSPEKPQRLVNEFGQRIKVLRDSNESVKAFFGTSPSADCQAMVKEFQFLLDRHETVGQSLREQLSYTASIASLKESRLGIEQNHSAKRLTQLAFVFIPLSFVTSVFGMNITPLSGDGAKRWTVLVGAAICYTLVAVPLLLLSRRWKEWRAERVAQKSWVMDHEELADL